MKTVLVGIPCLKVGGTEMQTLRLVEALLSGGHRVVTVCYFEYDYEMVQKFKLAGSRVECLSAYGNRPQGLRNQYRFLKKGLKRVVSEYHPTVAHIQYMAPGALPIIALRKLGINTILATSHTMGDIYKNLRLVRFVQRHYLKVFTCITEAAEKSFFRKSRLYTPQVPIGRHQHFTIYNTLAPNYEFSRDRQLGDTIRIGFVGSLKPIKGADLLLPAFAKFRQNCPNSKMIIVGEGELKEHMMQQEQELGLVGAVEWKGKLPYEKLPSIYQAIDLLWVPSRSEGFGLTAIEAMANGCIVIASNVGGLPEIISSPKLLFEKESINSLVQRSQDIINSDKASVFSLSQSMIERARMFQFDSYRESILSLYSRI